MATHIERRIGLALVAGLVLLLALAPGAGATGLTREQATKLQQRVDTQMRRVPGGRQIAPDRISWDDRGVMLKLPVPGKAQAAAGPYCPHFRTCVWEHANYRGLTGHFYKCTTYHLGDFGFHAGTPSGVSSWRNRQSGGAISWFYDSRWAVLWFAHAGQWANVDWNDNDRAMFIDVC